MFNMLHPACRLITQVRALRRDRRGVSAVEFAMLAPLMVALYLGGSEISQAVSIDRKVSLSARAIADLVAQGTTISDTEMTNIFNAGKAVAAPYPDAQLKLWVGSIKIDANKVATIAWSSVTSNVTSCTTTPPSSVELPSDSPLMVANTYLIWGRASYCYTPAVGHYITGTMKLSEEIYMRPRLQDKVCREGVVCS